MRYGVGLVENSMRMDGFGVRSSRPKSVVVRYIPTQKSTAMMTAIRNGLRCLMLPPIAADHSASIKAGE